MFAYRHAQVANDLLRHQQYRDRPRLTVAVTGSRGLIGSELVPFLTTGGHRVVRLVTGKAEPAFDDGTTWVNWDPRSKPDPAIFAGLDAVIHLAGENVASGRWNEKRKATDPRKPHDPHAAHRGGARGAAAPDRPKAFVCASAVGFYGNRGDEVLTEDSPPGDGFFPEVCRAVGSRDRPRPRGRHPRGEPAHRDGADPQGRRAGQATDRVQVRAGARRLGSGTQWTPWITIGDAVAAIHHCLMNEAVSGPVNVVAPNPVTNREFTRDAGPRTPPPGVPVFAAVRALAHVRRTGR